MTSQKMVKIDRIITLSNHCKGWWNMQCKEKIFLIKWNILVCCFSFKLRKVNTLLFIDFFLNHECQLDQICTWISKSLGIYQYFLLLPYIDSRKFFSNIYVYIRFFIYFYIVYTSKNSQYILTILVYSTHFHLDTIFMHFYIYNESLVFTWIFMSVTF